MQKNILIIGINSELALRTIEQLDKKAYNIYATSRHAGFINENIIEYHLDVNSEADFIKLKDKMHNVNFDTIINFTGLAIAGPVEELKETELKRQLDTNLFGLLRIIKYLTPLLDKNGKLINISSMASYGIFPFLSPYSISKNAADILLNNFSLETGIKTVSIRPGSVATKFWETSIENNKDVLNSKQSYLKEKEFIVKNAQKNSLHATNSIYVGKKIAHIIEKRNPKLIYNIGLDSKITKLSRFVSQNIINNMVRIVLKYRVLKSDDRK